MPRPRTSSPNLILHRPRGRPRDATLTTRRRSEILETATRAFADRGYQGTDLQVVADRLGVGKGTVYRYFPSKEQLFLAAVDDGMRRLEAHIDAAIGTETEPFDVMARAITGYLAFFDRNPEIIELVVLERAEFKDRKKPTYFEHREANLGRWREFFLQLVGAGRVRNIPAERALDVVSDLLYGTIFVNHFAGRRKALKRQATDIVDMVFHGLLPRPESTRGSRRPRPGRGHP